MLKRLLFGIFGLAIVNCNAMAEPNDDINALLSALRARPNVTLLSQREKENLLYYDVKLERLCDAGSLNSKTAAWVDGVERPPAFLSFLPSETRAVAFAATIGFPGTSKAAVSIPLIASASSGNVGKIDCNDIIVTDIPAGQVITVQFDFSAKSQWRANDPTPTLNAISEIGTALGALKLTLGGVVFSYITSNTATFANLTKATNVLLASFDVDRTPRPQSRRFEISAAKMAYNAARSEQFSVTKIGKLSVMRIGNGSGLFAGNSISVDFNRAFPNANLDTIFANVQSNIPNGWMTQVPAFCSALRTNLQTATQGDNVAVILALYYHAKINDYAYRNAGGNCLTRREIALLQGPLGYATAPYDLAYQQPFDGLLVAHPASGLPARVAQNLAFRTLRSAASAVTAVERKMARTRSSAQFVVAELPRR